MLRKMTNLSDNQTRKIALAMLSVYWAAVLPWVPQKETYIVNIHAAEHHEDYSRIIHNHGIEMGLPVEIVQAYINYDRNSDYFEKYQSEVPSIEAGDVVRITDVGQQSPLEIVVWSMTDSLPMDSWILKFMLGYHNHTEYQILK